MKSKPIKARLSKHVTLKMLGFSDPIKYNPTAQTADTDFVLIWNIIWCPLFVSAHQLYLNERRDAAIKTSENIRKEDKR